MQSLAEALRGKWSTTYEFEPSGMSPNGGTGTGKKSGELGPVDTFSWKKSTCVVPLEKRS